jgi:hypothetical protein
MLATSTEVDLRTPIPCLLLAAAALTACTATHRTRTVGKNHAAAELNLGGPITTALGPPVPMPVVFLGGRYGIRDDLDIGATYNLTAPIVPSIPLHLETAVHWAPIQPGLRDQPDDQGWSVVADGSVTWLSDFESGLMVFPALGVTGGYRYRFVAPYLGFTGAVNSYRPFARRGWLWFTPHVGLELMAGEHFGVTLEAAWMDVGHNLYGSGLQWIYLSKDEEENVERGAFAPMLGFTWDFDTRPNIGGGEQ